MSSSLKELQLWRWQRRTALIALPLVLLHVVLQYFVFGSATASYDVVSARLKLGAFFVLDLLLLAAVSSHAFIGLRSVLMDYAKSPAAARRATYAIGIGFAGVLIYGLAALAAFI